MADLLVCAKDLRPGDHIYLPAPTSGAAVEQVARVMNVYREIHRSSYDRGNPLSRVVETDSVTLTLIDDTRNSVSARQFSSEHTFAITNPWVKP